MKLAMKLRTRLFLSISALITLALCGLLLGLVSVIQMSNTQESLVRDNFIALNLGMDLRQSLGDQLVIMLSKDPDPSALSAARQHYLQLIDKGLEHSSREGGNNLLKARDDYQQFLQAFSNARSGPDPVTGNDAFAQAFKNLRNRLITENKSGLSNISTIETQSREHALLVAGLLGLVGLAVLIVGFITAHGIARRFATPIESLAKAADSIGRGNFEVILPISSVAEMNSLTRRFGVMAESLRQHQATNIDELVSGQQRLQSVLDSIDDGLLMIDRQGRLEHLNPVAQRQLGWDAARLGQGLAAALQRPELDQQVHLILHGGSLEQAPEDLCIDIEGETRLLTYSLTPVNHTQGHILGAVMVLHDVTEQRLFERVRSEFVLRASHELRTPVTGMHMAFGLFQERTHFSENSREADLLRTINDEMQRLMQLINDLLNFSRYQNGMQKLSRTPCVIQELLDHTRQRFTERANQRDIELLIETQPPLPRLYADQPQLERVLDNLLDNALRHTAAGGQIRLKARRHGERAIISIEDNGEGIAYGQQGRIFEPFVQVGRKKGGAGLGLALCKEIVQLHGGRMGVHSRPGQGTQFYMALPL